MNDTRRQPCRLDPVICISFSGSSQQQIVFCIQSGSNVLSVGPLTVQCAADWRNAHLECGSATLQRRLLAASSGTPSACPHWRVMSLGTSSLSALPHAACDTCPEGVVSRLPAAAGYHVCVSSTHLLFTVSCAERTRIPCHRYCLAALAFCMGNL